MDLKITPSAQTIVKPTALGPGANTDTKGRGKNNYQVFVVIHLLQG